jgi:hypothetical protein
MGFAWFSSNGKLQISSVGTKLALLHLWMWSSFSTSISHFILPKFSELP